MDPAVLEQIVQLMGQLPAPVIQMPEGEGRRRLPIKCPTFRKDGEEDWMQYIGRFEAFRGLLNLDEANSKSCLFMSLEGEAGKIARIFCPGTPEYDNNDYDQYCTILRTMFSSRAESQNAKTKFETRCQVVNEEVQAYAAHKLSLFRQAYLGTNGSEEHLVREFIRGLNAETVRREVIRAMPETYTAAIELAMNEEAAQLYELSLTKRGNEIKLDRKFNKPVIEDMEISNMNRKTTRRDSQGRYLPEEGCWTCGSMQHFKRDCPKQKGQSYNTRGRGTAWNRGRGRSRGNTGRSINALTEEEGEEVEDVPPVRETPAAAIQENEETDF